MIGGDPPRSGNAWPITAALVGALVGLAVAATASIALQIGRRHRPMHGVAIGTAGLLLAGVTLGAIAGVATTTESDRAVIGASVEQPGVVGGEATGEPTPPIPSNNADRRRPADVSSWFSITVLCIALLGLGAAMMFFASRSELRARARQPILLRSGLALEPEPADDIDDAELAAALQRALEGLAGDGDPRTRIRFAYGRMQHELGLLGFVHRPADTPRRYLARCLASPRLPAASIANVVDVFELARFSTRPITDRDADHAEAALRSIIHTLVSEHV